MPSAVFVPAQLNDLSVDVQLSSPARGDLFYRGASKWQNLAAGTAGKLLVTGGAGADPAWTDTLTVELKANGGITAPGAGTNSEAFGDGATAPQANSVAIGHGATMSSLSSGSVAIGSGASAGAGASIAIGYQAASAVYAGIAIGHIAKAGSNSIVIGYGSDDTGQAQNVLIGYDGVCPAGGNVAIGTNVTTTGYGGAVALGAGASVDNTGVAVGSGSHAAGSALAIGRLTNAPYSYSVALGAEISTTDGHQLVSCVNELYFFGIARDDGLATWPITLHGAGGSGTDIAAGNIVLAGGRGTGAGAGGAVVFQTAPAGATGTTPNTLQERARITQTGQLAVGTNAPNAAALLQLDSTTQGFLPPRLAHATDVPVPVEGLVVYDKANQKLMLYTGHGSTGWETISSS